MGARARGELAARSFARAERRRDLAERLVEDLVEEEGGALERGQAFEEDEERDVDRLGACRLLFGRRDDARARTSADRDRGGRGWW
jgi:hypothetical protein